MSDAKRKTLKLRQKDVSGEFPHPLDQHNAGMIGEQRRRINHPHDEGS